MSEQYVAASEHSQAYLAHIMWVHIVQMCTHYFAHIVQNSRGSRWPIRPCPNLLNSSLYTIYVHIIVIIYIFDYYNFFNL